jgi:hypothetical protein
MNCLQSYNATDSAEDAHLIMYVRYANGDKIKEDLLLCKEIKDQVKLKNFFMLLIVV